MTDDERATAYAEWSPVGALFNDAVARILVRDAFLAGVAAERERAAAIADQCATERRTAADGQPAILVPPQDVVIHILRAKQSEAERIATAVRGRGRGG